MSERSENILRKTANTSVILAAGACLILLAARIYFAISFVTPYLLSTTGFEWENSFNLWKFIQHQAIYTDPHRIPFTVSYYNWGYYYFYGWMTKAGLSLLRLDVIWIPTVGRLISLVFTLIAGAIFWMATRTFIKAGPFAHGPLAWAWPIIVTCSPLVGFWSITVRADMGALALEAAGLYVILHYLRKQDERLIVVAALLFYAAWSFKQSSVTMLAGSALVLLLLKRWRAFLTLSSIWWILVIVTLVAGGPVYRENILFSQKHYPMPIALGLENIMRAVEKNPFFLLCVGAILALSVRKLRLLASRPIEAALTFTVLFSCCFAFITACKIGASDNYYIPAAWAAMLGFALIAERMNVTCMLAGLAVFSWILVVAVALVPVGKTFYYTYRYQDVVHRSIAEKLSHLPGPAFVQEPYSNLPWVQRFSPHFVIPDTYSYDRDAGVPLEDGGWEGLAREGYFATLVLYRGYQPPASMLAKYALVDQYRQDGYMAFDFYRRIAPAP
jgi:hypothetical protein